MRKIRQKTYDMLRSSEKYTKTDMIYLTKGGFWLLIGQFITALAAFLSALLFARLVPKEIYGNYKYILSLAGLAATFTLSGLSSGVLQSVARGFYGTFIEAVRTSIRWNSPIFVFAVGGAIYYLYQGNTTIGYSLIVIALLYPIIRTLEMYEAFISGTKNFRSSSLFRGIVDIGTIVATAIAILVTDSAFILVTVNLSAQFLLNSIFFRKVYTSISAEDRKKVEPGIINFSKHLSLQNVLANVASHLDKIIIFHYLGAAEVAIYIFALAIPQQIKGFITIVPAIAVPKISERPIKEAVNIIPRRFGISLLILIPVVVIYIIFAPMIFQIFFPAYTEAIIYTRWYALIILLMGNFSDLVLTVKKAVKEKYVLNIFASLSQIILMFFLIHSFKIYGVIWAILISKYLTAILSYILVKRFARERAVEIA